MFYMYHSRIESELEVFTGISNFPDWEPPYDYVLFDFMALETINFPQIIYCNRLNI